MNSRKLLQRPSASIDDFPESAFTMTEVDALEMAHPNPWKNNLSMTLISLRHIANWQQVQS